MVTKEERKEQKRIYLRENRAFWREHGICVKCGKEKAFHTYRCCADCLEKERQRKRRYEENKTSEQKKNTNEWRRNYYAKHKEQGLCVDCCKKAAPGTIYCIECRLKHRRATAEWSARSGRKKFYEESGLCIRCGGERVEDKKLCASCLEKQRQSMAYARQFAPGGEFWNRL